MRLNRIVRRRIFTGEGDAFVLVVQFSVAGVSASIILDLPDNWDQLTRSQKVDWAKQ